jgi:DNA-binding Lrp family transcriptional regulator
MDVKDRQILACLDDDSRMPFSLISRKTRTSQETVRYRIHHLFKEGIIDRCITIINTPRLGYTPYQLFIKLQHADEEQKQKMIKYLKTIHSISWIGDLEGNYDIGIIFIAKNHDETNRVLVKIYENYSQWILKKTLAVNLEGKYLSRAYLTGKSRTHIDFPHYTTATTTIDLDEKDKIICGMLAQDARIPLIEIAKKTRLISTGTIHRIKELKKKNILKKHLLIINNEKFGQEHYKILLYLNNTTEQKNKKLIASAQENNHVIAIIKSLAEWDYEIDIEVEKRADVTTFLKTITVAHASIIRDYDIIRIKSMPKFTFYPDQRQTLNTPGVVDGI